MKQNPNWWYGGRVAKTGADVLAVVTHHASVTAEGGEGHHTERPDIVRNMHAALAEDACSNRAPAMPASDFPTGLTAEMLEHLLAHVNLGAGGRSGGWTPEKAVKLAETWARDPKAFAAEIKARQRRKNRRKNTKS